MITRAKADQIEKLTGQLKGIHRELAALAKKSPNDGVNIFKLKFVNMVLLECNKVLAEGYRPLGDFEKFDVDDLPSNSDVTFVVSQYLEALEKLRSDNVKVLHGDWVYDIPEEGKSMRAAKPQKLRE